jgi:hypothetical protein
MSQHEQLPFLTASDAADFLNLNPQILNAMRRNDVDRDGSPYLTVAEAAAFLRLKPRTLDNMRCNGVGPTWTEATTASFKVTWVQEHERFGLARAGPQWILK